MTHRQQDLVKLKCLIAHQSRAVVILLSAGTLHSVVQLTAMLEAMEQLQGNGVPAVIPVSLPGFCFPDNEYYKTVLPQIWPSNTAKAERMIRSFFKHIAVSFDTRAADAVLDLQTASILRLIPRTLPTTKTSRREPKLAEPDDGPASAQLAQHSTL